MSDSYRTPAAPVRIKLPVGACRFIASLSPASTESEAREFIHSVTNHMADANHHAYAYRIGHGDGRVCRTSDDGEPPSTAGPPMLDVLEKYHLSNVVVVGSRYFGGVKLGVGGLVRAYRSCAEEGVKASRIETRYFTRLVSFCVPYSHLGNALRELETLKGRVLKMEYGPRVTVTGEIREKFATRFFRRLGDASRGRAVILREQDGTG